ncbi:MAG: hypothetical protein ACQESN_06575 [Thermotogota bacterium]
MRKVLILLFSLIIIFSFSNDFKNFFMEMDLKELVEDQNPDLKSLSSFLIYWNNQSSNYNIYPNTHEYIKDFISFEDIQLTMVNKLKYFENNEPNSIQAYALELYFLDNYWRRTRDVHVVDRIIELKDIINSYYNEQLPRTAIAVSNIYWNSNIFTDRDQAYELIKTQFEKFPNNEEILNIFTNMSYTLKKTEYVDELFEYYDLNSNYNEQTLLYFIYAFLDNGEVEKAEGLSTVLINRSTNQSNKAKAYELLGDYTDNLEDKVENYQKSISQKFTNGSVLGKLGVSLYQLDPEKYAEASRAYLNSATAYGYSPDEVTQILSKLRWRLIFKNFLIFMVPFILITGIGIYFIIKWERWKRDDDLGKHILGNN